MERLIGPKWHGRKRERPPTPLALAPKKARKHLAALMAWVLDLEGRATRGSLHLRPRREREANRQRMVRRAARVVTRARRPERA